MLPSKDGTAGSLLLWLSSARSPTVGSVLPDPGRPQGTARAVEIGEALAGGRGRPAHFCAFQSEAGTRPASRERLRSLSSANLVRLHPRLARRHGPRSMPPPRPGGVLRAVLVATCGLTKLAWPTRKRNATNYESSDVQARVSLSPPLCLAHPDHRKNLCAKQPDSTDTRWGNACPRECPFNLCPYPGRADRLFRGELTEAVLPWPKELLRGEKRFQSGRRKRGGDG